MYRTQVGAYDRVRYDRRLVVESRIKPFCLHCLADLVFCTHVCVYLCVFRNRNFSFCFALRSGEVAGAGPSAIRGSARMWVLVCESALNKFVLLRGGVRLLYIVY